MEESTIRLSNIGIGTVQLDPAEIKGEGDEYDPRLVIPIQIELNQQPKERQIVIVRLSASLHLNHATGHSDQFASKVSYELTNDMSIASTYGAPNKRRLAACRREWSSGHASCSNSACILYGMGRSDSMEPTCRQNTVSDAVLFGLEGCCCPCATPRIRYGSV